MAKKAGMSTGVEVARITVKVSPDSREFRRELTRQLNDFEKSAKDKAKANLTVETGEAEKKVSRSTKNMAETAKKNLSNISLSGGSKDPLTNFANSMAEFNASTKRAAALRQKLGSLDLRWEKKVANFRQERLKPQMEIAQLRAESDRVLNEFDAQMSKTRAVNYRFDVELDKQQAYTVVQGLKDFFNKNRVKVPVGVDASGGSGNGGDGGGGFLGLLGKGKSAGIPSFGTGINPAGWAAILAGILIVATPLIGLITTALLSLPGLLSLLLAPIAAVTLGLDGFKKAAETIKPQFEELKNIMSEAAETSFTPVMQSIADTIFPLLERSLPRVTQGLADFAQGAVDAFRDPQTASQFEGSIRRIGEAFTAMRPGMDSFVSGFIGLIDQFSLKLPDITKWFNDTGKDFDNWVRKISANGELSTAFDQLGGFIKTVLDALGQLALTGFDLIKKPDSLDGFIESVKNLGTALNEIAELSGKLNDAWDFIFGGRIEPAQAEADAKLNELARMAGGEGTKAEVDKITSAVNEAGKAAEANKPKVEEFLGSGEFGGANASRERRGLAAVEAPAKVEVPDTTEAEAKITEYQGFVDNVTQQVRGALSQATSGETLPAPNFEAFKAAWNELPNVVRSATDSLKGTATQAVQGVVEIFNSGGALIALTVASWPDQVKGALQPLATAGSEIAAQMVQGMVAGINGGIGSVTAAARSLAQQAAAAAKAELGIKSPSRVFMGIGENTAKGFGVGMENGFQPVLDQAKDMAGKIADAFANGTDPTGGIAGYSKQDLTRMEKVLGLETKRLETQAKALDYQAKATGNEALKARAAELRLQKDQLSLQKDMLGLTKDYNDEAGSGEDPFVKAASGLMKSPVDFAKATGQQFLSDLGISGDGMISKAITEGISYVFNIGSVDEALSIKERQDSKQAMSIVGR